MSQATLYEQNIANQQLAFKSKQVAKALAFTILAVLCVSFLVQFAEATNTTDEFADTATKFEGWIKGNLGKAIALVALIFGAGFAAIKKDGVYLVMAIFIAIGLGLIVSIINASFTAII